MSRIGRQPIIIPEGVQVQIEGRTVTVTGQRGSLTQQLLPGFEIEQKENRLELVQKVENPETLRNYGLLRSLIANMVTGVSEGFSKTLEIHGVGYRVQLKGSELVLSLGYSHPINYQAPAGIELKTEQNNIIVTGYDKQLVGEVAAQIREFRKPEPYKGKGIRYQGEHIRRKAGKTAAKTGAGA
ncbi:50S ribosomal protein L6 [Candidatus Saccharibacteria bacterium]|nr:50S ribosomal protein L6 [Candidatus Saccharibacteria bacterium]